MTKNQSHDPLLYIQQPEINYPKAKMQQTYMVNESVEETAAETLTTKPSNTEVQKKEVVDHGTNKSSKDQKIAIINEKHQDAKEPVQEEENKKDLNSYNIQKVIEDYNQNNEDETFANTTKKTRPYSFSKVKAFREMNTEEKINYLYHFPKMLPPVPCVFVMENSVIRGFLIEKTEEAVEVKQFNDKVIEISIEKITDVKMIGLRK